MERFLVPFGVLSCVTEPNEIWVDWMWGQYGSGKSFAQKLQVQIQTKTDQFTVVSTANHNPSSGASSFTTSPPGMG